MQYNVCKICGAKDGRAGFLVGNRALNLVDACQNCDDTRKTGIFTLHAHLSRTSEEIQKTASLLEFQTSESNS